MQHYTGQALTDAAKPAGGANIGVKIAGTNNNAVVYSDDGITAKSNPFSADALGHFDFYVASGKCDITISGTQITTYTMPNQVVFDPFEVSAGDLPVVTIANAAFPLNASGVGGFWVGLLTIPNGASVGANPMTANANEVRICQFFLLFRFQLGRVSYRVEIGSGGTIGDFGIYDTSGNKLANTGGFSTASIGQATTNFLSAPILNPGYYYFAWTNSSAAPIVTAVQLQTNSLIVMNNGGSKLWGKAANAASSGVLPATLGALTNETTYGTLPTCYLER